MTRLYFLFTVGALWAGLLVISIWLWKLMDAVEILAKSITRLHGL